MVAALCHAPPLWLLQPLLQPLPAPPNLVFTAMIKHHEQKHLVEKRVYLVHSSMSQSLIEILRARTQGQNLKLGIEAENMEEKQLTDFLSIFSHIF